MTEENTAANPETPPAADPDKFTVDNIDRRFYGPEALADSNSYVANCVTAAEENDLPVYWNIDPAAPEIPDGYGLAITPVQQREGKGEGLKIIGVLIGACPTYEALELDEKGAKFIRQTIQELLIGKMVAAARPRGNEKIGQTPFTLPISIADFIERRSGESLKSYTEISGDFVAALKKQGMKFINATMLRECLANTEFSKEQFPGVEQTSWLAVIAAMRDTAVSKSLDPQIFDHWKETRDTATMAETTDESILGALAGLTGANTTEETEPVPAAVIEAPAEPAPAETPVPAAQ